MDNLTELIISEIKKQYKSVRQFSIRIGVPQTTVVSALKKGVNGTAYETVLKMCQALDIKAVNYDSHILINQDVEQLIRKFNMLDEKGAHTVLTVLQMECDRCQSERNSVSGAAAAFGGQTVHNGGQDAQKNIHHILRNFRNKN